MSTQTESAQTDCIFCKIIAGDMPSHTIYEDDDVVAFMDINPVNPGHVLIVPKEHAENFLKSSQDTMCKLMSVATSITPAILEAVEADSCNFTTNCGRSAGQVVFHTHFHIIPRFPTDGHEQWQRKGDEQDDLKALAEQIKENV